MKEEQKKCTFSFKNCSCELKVAYILILLIIVSMLFCCFKRCSKNETKNNTANIEKEIFAWVDKNPKAILDSVEKYVQAEQAKNQKEQAENSTKNIKENISKLRDTKNTGVANPKGNKVVVAFYDYNCGYCKMASKNIEEIAKDSSIKIVFRELPILGQPSTVAAEYSVAVAMTAPSKFLAFHTNLFNGNARTKDGVLDAIRKSGINLNSVEKTLKDKKADIDKRLNDNRELASLIGLRGTPAFVVGEEFVPGFIEKDQMLSILNK